VFLIFSCFTMTATHSYAQDVAEAAKQERARKQAQQKKSKHVYTEEDLKRAQILTPEDRAELEAARKQTTPPSSQDSQQAAGSRAVGGQAGNAPSAPPLDWPAVATDADHLGVLPGFDVQPLPPGAPLGDVARRYRQLKFSQQLQRSAEFHLPFVEAPILASPKPMQPLRPPLPVTKPTPPTLDFSAAPSAPIVRSSSPRLAPLAPSLQPSRPLLPVIKPSHPRFAPSQPIVKRSPFSRPPAYVFAQPRINPSRPLVTPAAPLPPAVRVVPAPPTADAAPASSLTLSVVTVMPGDSLWKIAEQHLGQGLRWHDLLAVNPGILDPDHIVVGTQICLPSLVSPVRATTEFIVRPGDTLWSIARTHFGRASAWLCVANANPSLRDPNHIYPGQSLVLPASCKL
jgi:nucleoid-associated protein YgaU